MKKSELKQLIREEIEKSTSLRSLYSDIYDFLYEVQEYMEGKSDVDTEDYNRPNKEMRFEMAAEEMMQKMEKEGLVNIKR